MLPLLELLSDGSERTVLEVTQALAIRFQISDADLELRIPSGSRLFASRVGWAKTYLKKAGLVLQPRRAVLLISDRGREVLTENPKALSNTFLQRYEEYRAFTRPQTLSETATTTAENLMSTETPEALLESSHQTLRAALAQDLVEQVLECSPSFFERLVVELLVAMGYGGSIADAGRAVGRSGDEGIDGIIKEDRLGLDVIYLQAKRWQGVVGRPEIQKFVGALSGQRAKKGVMITTSAFTNEARAYAAQIESKVVLIDGAELAELMIDFNLGTQTVRTYELKRIDGDYFTED